MIGIFTISCNGHKIETSWNLGVTLQSTDASFTFTYTDLGNGFVNINTVPAASTQVPGMLHYWGIQYNGTYPNCTACASIDFLSFNSSGVIGGYIDAAGVLHPYMGSGITKGTTNYGINYSGFPTVYQDYTLYPELRSFISLYAMCFFQQGCK